MTNSKRKQCRLCQKSKPLSEFYRAANSRDGHRTECKNCFRKVVRDAERRHLSQTRARKRAWYRAHKTYFKRYKRRYHREHREEIKAYFKKYYDEHKEYFRRKRREYRQKHLKEVRAYNKEWSRRWRAKVKRERARHSLPTFVRKPRKNRRT